MRAGRSGVASGALTKWGSNLGWALLPRAGAAFSRRARGAAASLGAFAPRLLARRSLRTPRFALLSCISVSSFFGFAGTAFFAAFGSCFGTGAAAFAAFAGAVSACFFGASAKFSASGRGFLPRTGSTGRTGAGTPSHGWPDTTGILRRFSFSMPARYSCSSGAQKLTAVPSAPARAVRPMRCT